jgi:photosystem II stability/assembly factor-like uncharacterized protein
MGFDMPILKPPSDCGQYHYLPKLELLEDTLYVCSNKGIYKKNLKDDTEWEIFAFENIPIIKFLKNENIILATSTGTRDGKDSLLFLSIDNGQTFINYTHSHFFEEWSCNYLTNITQNPENKNSILISQIAYGLSKSSTFGLSWDRLSEVDISAHYCLGYHPLDTTILYSAGETDYFDAVIYKSSDNGNTWIERFRLPDNIIFCMAFHPTNHDILVVGTIYGIGKSTDRGQTWNWNVVEMDFNFQTILFDEKKPEILYAAGFIRNPIGDNIIRIYRSTDMGNNWELAYNENLHMSCFGVNEMIKYENKLIVYTRNCGLFELTIEDVGINEVESAKKVAIFPNPTTDEFKIESGGLKLRGFEIFDVYGRKLPMSHASLSTSETVLNISHLPAGVYFGKINTEAGQVRKKVVKE